MPTKNSLSKVILPPISPFLPNYIFRNNYEIYPGAFLQVNQIFEDLIIAPNSTKELSLEEKTTFYKQKLENGVGIIPPMDVSLFLPVLKSLFKIHKKHPSEERGLDVRNKNIFSVNIMNDSLCVMVEKTRKWWHIDALNSGDGMRLGRHVIFLEEPIKVF